MLTLALASVILAQSPNLPSRYEQYRSARQERDETIWTKEKEALRHEQYFVALWDGSCERERRSRTRVAHWQAPRRRTGSASPCRRPATGPR